MKRWPTMRLGDLVLSTQQRDPRQKPGEEFCYVDIAGIDNETKTIGVAKRIVGAYAPSRARKVIHMGDVIVSTVRPNLNAVAIVPDNLDKQLCSTGFSVLRPSSKVTSGYLFAFVRSPFFIDCLIARTTGANYPAVNDGEVKDVPIPVPPLAEQERIVKLLDEADELRKLRAQADHRTDALIPSLFHEMFGEPALNPFGWPVECVGTLFDVKRGGAKCGPFGSALKKHEYVASGIPVWGIPNVLPNQFVEVGSLFISPSKFEELRAYAVEPGDLLFSRAGTVGRICVANPKKNDSIIGTNLIRLALDRKRVVPEFFATLMTHFGAKVGRLRASADESAYSFMNTTILKALRIYLPPIKLQEEFAARVSEIRAMQAEQSASRHRLDDLFQSLLHRAFK